jgi:hypothetical protein
MSCVCYRKNDYHNFVYSMKASNPLVMVQVIYMSSIDRSRKINIIYREGKPWWNMSAPAPSTPVSLPLPSPVSCFVPRPLVLPSSLIPLFSLLSPCVLCFV